MKKKEDDGISVAPISNPTGLLKHSTVHSVVSAFGRMQTSLTDPERTLGVQPCEVEVAGIVGA